MVKGEKNMYIHNKYGNPNYNDKQNFTTNAESYLEYLGTVNDQLDSIMKLIDRLINRDVDVEDTNTVNLTKMGDFINELDPNLDLEEVIKIKADVLISQATGDGQLNSLLPKPLVLELENAVKAKNDGIFVKDLAEMIKALDDHVNTLIDRVDEINVDGSIVQIGGFNQYDDTLTEQVNQQQVKASLVKDDPSITNLTLVTDIHLRTDYNGYSSKQYYNAIHNIQDVAHETHAVFYMGDNIDGLNGQVTDYSGMIDPERIKYANEQAYRKAMNALVVNEPVDTIALIGNHDVGGLPYLKESEDHSKMMLSADYLAKTAGNPAFGVHKIPNQGVAVVYLNTMEITWEEGNSYESGISKLQLNWLQQQLNLLESDYHVLVLGHHNLHSVNMKNGQELIDILTEFETRETSKFIGYFHGHQHMDKAYPKGVLLPFNVMCLVQAFPANVSQANANNQVGFYVVTINTKERAATFKPIGHSTLTNILTY